MGDGLSLTRHTPLLCYVPEVLLNRLSTVLLMWFVFLYSVPLNAVMNFKHVYIVC